MLNLHVTFVFDENEFLPLVVTCTSKFY